MAKKSELESAYYKHEALVELACNEEKAGNYQSAIAISLQACDYINGMLQFMSRYQDKKEVQTFESVEVVMRHAPFIFDWESLDRLAELLKSQRRIEKNTTADLAESISTARALMWDAYRLWNYLEDKETIGQEELRTKNGSICGSWQAIIKRWIQMGLVAQIPEMSYALATCMDAKVRGKCPSCGATGASSKEKLLHEIQCPRCKNKVHFVLLSPAV